MAITTLAGLRSGLLPRKENFLKQVAGSNGISQKYWLSWWGVGAGLPANGAFDNTLNGVTLSSTAAQVAGQIPYTDPASGNCYLAGVDYVSRASTFLGSPFSGVILADRLWHNKIDQTSTSQQNITTPTWPSRDALGGTNGVGVLIAMELSAANGTNPGASDSVTIGYTNSDGTSGRSGAAILRSGGLIGIAGLCCPIGLQAGDRGVKSVESVTLGATWGTGTMNLVAYRPIAFFGGGVFNTPLRLDALQLGMPQLYNGSVPYLIQARIISDTGNTEYCLGSLQYAQG